MRSRQGRFLPGISYSPKTQFKKGTHWRERKPFWEREWLCREYVDNQRSSADIARQFGVTESAILFWLRKHAIAARHMAEIRKIKHWGLGGETNGMFGKTGILNPNWRGGHTPLRQQIYASHEWRKFSLEIRKRDKVCRLCESDKKLEIHHIEPFSQSPLLVMFLGNAILLCADCHHKMYGREKRWRKKLLNIIEKGGQNQYGVETVLR